MLDTGLRINLSHHPNVDANQQSRVRWRIQLGLGRIMIDLTIAAQREKARMQLLLMGIYITHASLV